MKTNILKSLLVTTICIFSLVACNLESEELTSNSISDCPIAQNKLVSSKKDLDSYGITDTKIINNLPTLESYFNKFLEGINSNNRLTANITWEQQKENYYIFSITMEDTVVNKVDNMKFGVCVLKSGRVAITDYWENDNYRENLGINFLVYELAKEETKNNIKNKANGSSNIQLGNYSAEYPGGEAVISLNDGGEGFFEAETYNRIKWKQVNSEIEMRIYGEEGSPQFTVINAKILSDTSFDLEGVVYNLVKE